MGFIKKVIAWSYYRLVFPVYTIVIEREKKKREVQKKYHIEKRNRNVVIFGTPNHGNLGDYAIYAAEKKLFCRFLPTCNVFGVNMTDFQHEVQALKKLLKKEDLLILTGGGNLGNQYMDDEIIRRTVIQTFPNNRIIMFPQTLYFTPDVEGERESIKTAAIYNAHKDLYLMARDAVSYHAMREKFTGSVQLLPDVVLTWGSFPVSDKDGVLVVLRNDLESIFGEKERQQIYDMLRAEYATVETTDTEIEIDGKADRLEQCLEEKMQQFNRAELIVTDRLHGMIFAALAQTPCIVLNNYNHKLKETYRWIQHLDYIFFLESADGLREAVCRLKDRKDCKFENKEIEERYKAFLEEVVNG